MYKTKYTNLVKVGAMESQDMPHNHLPSYPLSKQRKLCTRNIVLLNIVSNRKIGKEGRRAFSTAQVPWVQRRFPHLVRHDQSQCSVTVITNN